MGALSSASSKTESIDKEYLSLLLSDEPHSHLTSCSYLCGVLWFEQPETKAKFFYPLNLKLWVSWILTQNRKRQHLHLDLCSDTVISCRPQNPRRTHWFFYLTNVLTSQKGPFFFKKKLIFQYSLCCMRKHTHAHTHTQCDKCSLCLCCTVSENKKTLSAAPMLELNFSLF